MAKALAVRRSTAQPITIDTVSGAITNLGATIASLQTTSLFPARCVNLETTFDGETYALVLNNTSSVEIRKLVSGNWNVMATYTPGVDHTFTPLCAHVVNNTITAIWTDLHPTTFSVIGFTGAISVGDTFRQGVATATVLSTSSPGPAATVKVNVTAGTFVLGAFTGTPTTLNLTSYIGTINIGDVITQGLTTGIVVGILGLTVQVNVTAGVFVAGAFLDTSSGATGVIASVTPATSGTISVITPSADGIRVVTSTDGTTWSAINNGTKPILDSLGGHSIVYKSAIWFATATGLWSVAPLHRSLTLAPVVGTFTVGEQVTAPGSKTGIVRGFSGSTLKIDSLTGPAFVVTDIVTGVQSGAVGTITAITIFTSASLDTGDDLGLTGATGASNLLGCFTNWDGVLFFLQPKTANGPTKIYKLSPLWTIGTVAVTPQWTNTAYTGLPDPSFVTVANDAGSACLFANNNDALCVLFSGATGTKLARTTSKVAPLMFTDVTNSILPASLAVKTSLGIVLYDDDRRRTNNKQWLLIRDVAASSLYVCPWDGTNALTIAATLPGADYLLPASHAGEEVTYTNFAPSVRITAVSAPFPGRTRIDYKVRCNPAHPVDVFGEYTIDGTNFFPMTQGDGDSGSTNLATSPSGSPVGTYFFYWDAFVDLDGDFESMGVRIFARISGV